MWTRRLAKSRPAGKKSGELDLSWGGSRSLNLIHLHHLWYSFASTSSQPTSKVSVKVLVDEWLCRKIEKLNVTVQEGNPSRSSETG